ncbi:hypothetical protein KFL_000610050 [Klebsormidium nitens]|uniref:Uncharacterized protein n=1 Tax=Klebsormidium nitens TaxID=105231 RepID=A0A0U9HR78_KLENI|nr:hypothetical protein KFL_000610050 [Klebsormidium nitens]|eukprot:GAQ80727.1 hypothetical protein KFL_000610050 [Klebsormidium nitens]
MLPPIYRKGTLGARASLGTESRIPDACRPFMSLRGRHIPLSTQFEQAAALGRAQARQSETPWAGRLRRTSISAPALAPPTTVAERRPRGRASAQRSEAAVKDEKEPQGEKQTARGRKDVGRKRKQAEEKAVRRSKKSAVTPEAEDKGRTTVTLEGTGGRRHGWKSAKTRRAAAEGGSEEDEYLSEIEPELPDMAEEELGPYAEAEEAAGGEVEKHDKEAGGRARRGSNTAERYGQKRDMSPKTPDASKVGEQVQGDGDKAAEGDTEVPRGSRKEDALMVSPGTVVKHPVGTKGAAGSPVGAGYEAAAGVTSPASIKALKATFELGVRAELEARREETARKIEGDRERMKEHEVALRKRVREREEAAADRERAVVEVEEYVVSKKRAAEDLERRAKRAREEAQEAEKEREEAKERAEREYEARIAGLGLDEEQRAIEELRAAIAEREKVLQASARAEGEAVGALVNEQLAELQRKVDRIWGQQLGAPNGA